MQRPTRGDFLDSRSFASAVLLEKIVREAYEKRQSCEVQPLQWSILRYLGSEGAERCTIGWIASFLGITHAPVVRAVKTLRKRNYVTQEQNPEDARSKIVRLTQEGWKQLRLDPLCGIAQRIDGLTEDDKNALMSAIKTLVAPVQDEKDDGNAPDPAG